MEFSLIHRIRQRAAAGATAGVVLGIGDDAALLQVPAGRLLVVTTDTLNVDVHFPRDTAPADLGWKTLAVSLSDLAAMGATPAWCTLALTLPEAEATWLDAFCDGFFALADAHGVALVGGDTTRGPFALGLTAFGHVAAEAALRRDGARDGDDVWITGSTGDAAAALAQWRRRDAIDPELRARLDRPQPRVAAGRALAGLASACIDVSDGLLADLGHVLDASGVGATLELDALPASPALQRATDAVQRAQFQLAGGDDYELCFTAAPARRTEVAAALRDAGVDATRIGRICAARGLRVIDARGIDWPLPRAGWDHFAGGAGA